MPEQEETENRDIGVCAAETRKQRTSTKRRAFPAVLPPPPLVFPSQKNQQGQAIATALQIPPFQGVLSTFGIDNFALLPDAFPPVLLRCACCRCNAKRKLATQSWNSCRKLCVAGEGAAQNKRRSRRWGMQKSDRSGRGVKGKSSEGEQRPKHGRGCFAECNANSHSVGNSSVGGSSSSNNSRRSFRVARSLSRTAGSSQATQGRKLKRHSFGEEKEEKDECSSCSCFCLERRETFWKGLKPGEGRSILICGPVGSGKSVLLRTLATALINSTESWNSRNASQRDKKTGAFGGGGQWASRQRGGVLFTHVADLLHAEVGASQQALLQLFATAAGRDAIICAECIDVIFGVAGSGGNEKIWIEDDDGDLQKGRREAEKKDPWREEEREENREEEEIYEREKEEEEAADADDPIAALQGELMQLFITLVDVYVRQRGITLLCTISTRPQRLPLQLSRCFTDTMVLGPIIKK